MKEFFVNSFCFGGIVRLVKNIFRARMPMNKSLYKIIKDIRRHKGKSRIGYMLDFDEYSKACPYKLDLWCMKGPLHSYECRYYSCPFGD